MGDVDNMSLSTFSFSEIYQRFFQIYRTQLENISTIFQYIDDSTQDIDLPTQNDNIKKHGYCSGNYYRRKIYETYIV